MFEDYKKVLATDEGQRIFGGIFSITRLNRIEVRNEYSQGLFSMGLMIANTIREVDPFGVAKCEIAYKKFKEMYENAGRDNGESE